MNRKETSKQVSMWFGKFLTAAWSVLLQAVPRLRHIQDPGATEESADGREPGLEGRLLALGVGGGGGSSAPWELSSPWALGLGSAPRGGRWTVLRVGTGAGEA